MDSAHRGNTLTPDYSFLSPLILGFVAAFLSTQVKYTVAGNKLSVVLLLASIVLVGYGIVLYFKA